MWLLQISITVPTAALQSDFSVVDEGQSRMPSVPVCDHTLGGLSFVPHTESMWRCAQQVSKIVSVGITNTKSSSHPLPFCTLPGQERGPGPLVPVMLPSQGVKQWMVNLAHCSPSLETPLLVLTQKKRRAEGYGSIKWTNWSLYNSFKLWFNYCLR